MRSDGDWEAWLHFFLRGVHETAIGAVTVATRLRESFADDRARIQASGRKAGSLLRVHEALMARPLTNLTTVAQHSGLSFPTVSSCMDALLTMGIVSEISGRNRNQVFTYDRYLTALGEPARSQVA